MTSDALKRYDFYQGPKQLGDVWTLARGALRLKCALATHPLGWELRLSAGASFARSHVCKSQPEVDQVADAWKSEALTKGWSDGQPSRDGT